MDMSVTTEHRGRHKQNYGGDTARCKPLVGYKYRIRKYQAISVEIQKAFTIICPNIMMT